MKTIIRTLLAITALATIGGCASSHSSCSATGSRKVILDGKKVTVADCQFTAGLRSVRFFPVR